MGVGLEGAGPRLPWMVQGGKSLSPLGRRLGGLGVSMPTGKMGVSLFRNCLWFFLFVTHDLLSRVTRVMTLCDEWCRV